jgi:hypothetical protein
MLREHHLPHTVTSVHVGSGGQPLVTDGPFLEGTEVIGGVAEIEVADLDEALRLAKAWSVHAPGYNVVEIWPVVEERRLSRMPCWSRWNVGRSKVFRLSPAPGC